MTNRRLAWLLCLACCVPHLIKWAYYANYPGFDDAFIHLRVAENLAHGKGWGVNAFEPINVSSSPLFTLLLAAGVRLGLPHLGFGMLLSMAATSAAVGIAFVIVGMAVSRWSLALPAALIFAINLHLWRWNGTVMEPTIACVLLGGALAVLSWARRGEAWRFAAFGAVTALAFLARFELALLMPAAWLALWCSSESRDRELPRLVRRSLAAAAGFAPIALAWFAFCLTTFGTIVPTTFVSKASSLSVTNWVTLRSTLIVLGTSLGLPLLIAALTSARTARQRGRASIRSLWDPFLPAWFFAILCATFYVVSMPEFQSPGRYLLPAVYALCIAIAGVSAVAIDRYGIVLSRAFLTGAGTVQIVGMLVLHHVSVAPVLAAFHENYWRASRQAAESLARTATSGEPVFALSDMGMLAYYSQDRYRVVDAAALAAPWLAGLPLDEKVRRSHARFVVEHYGSASTDTLTIAPGLTYHRVEAFPFAAPGLLSTRSDYSLNVYRRASK